MTKRPQHPHPDGIAPGVTVRVLRGAHKGETGVVTQAFRRPGGAHSTVHVKGIPSSKWAVEAFPLSCVEVVRE